MLDSIVSIRLLGLLKTYTKRDATIKRGNFETTKRSMQCKYLCMYVNDHYLDDDGLSFVTLPLLRHCFQNHLLGKVLCHLNQGLPGQTRLTLQVQFPHHIWSNHQVRPNVLHCRNWVYPPKEWLTQLGKLRAHQLKHTERLKKSLFVLFLSNHTTIGQWGVI